METVRKWDERFYKEISFVLRDKKINPKWKSLGQLLDALESYVKQYDDTIIFLCQLMNKTSDTNRSTFIEAFFTYHNLPFAPYSNSNGHINDAAPNTIVPKPIHGFGNVKRKRKVR